MTSKWQMANGKWQIQRAFTLIELLVVISIIGILIGLSVFGLQGARTSSRDARRKADLEQIRSGVEIFKADCNKYYIGNSLPATKLIGIVDPDNYGPSCLPANEYISQIPVDPVPTQNYSYKSTDGIKYYLCASLEQIPSGTPDPDLSNCNCGGSSCNYIVKNP